jgi:predicted transcriptional regulator
MPRPKKKNLKLFTMKVEENQYLKYKDFAKSKNKPLSKIIKMLLDDQPIPENVIEKKEPKRVYNKVNPELIRQISAIGNNLNQIARRLNQKEEFDVVLHLHYIEKQLQEILDAH